LIGQRRTEAQVNAKPMSGCSYQRMADIDVFGASEPIEDQMNWLASDLSREFIDIEPSETSDSTHPGAGAPGALVPGSVKQLASFLSAEVSAQYG
jgi:hypothetical protein